MALNAFRVNISSRLLAQQTWRLKTTPSFITIIATNDKVNNCMEKQLNSLVVKLGNEGRRLNSAIRQIVLLHMNYGFTHFALKRVQSKSNPVIKGTIPN